MKPVVVSISPFPQDHAFLGGLLECRLYALRAVHTVGEAVALLRAEDISVIICERDLPDGNWTDILTHAETLASAPCLIVTSRLADDRLWAEVLNLGGYDVLAKPFCAEEAARVIALAHGHWSRERERKGAQSISILRAGVASGS